MLPQVPLLPGSSICPVDLLSQMKTMMDEVLILKLILQNRELTKYVQTFIVSVRIDLAAENKKRLVGQNVLELRMKAL